ncbi:phage tail assembly protein [Vibrio quintilis]|uniref:Phage tail protein E n=1 Tax=Vibrio quintilis TaxID=1117707 RepID=A0A1M7YYX5_9VIBR|nr:phage tail assembly protein [Vibrio quintilis]SHO57784.1 Phage tail protein E [Vibrio quintilis]
MTELNKAQTTETNDVKPTNTPAQFPGADKVIALDTALDDGKITCVALRKPMPGDLRGLKLLDIIQMDAGAVAQLIPRIAINHFTAQHFYQLDPADLLEIMTEIATFFTKDQHLTQ